MVMPPRVGLLTLPLHTNYGGMVQAVALYRIVTADLQCEAIFLERAAAVPQKSLLRRAVIGAAVRMPFIFALRTKLSQAAQNKGALAKFVPPALAKKAFSKVDRMIRIRRSKEHLPFLQRTMAARSGILTSTQDMAASIGRFGIDTLVVGSDQVWRLGYHPPGAEEDFFFGFAPSPAIRKVSYAASFGFGDWKYAQHTERVKELLARFDAVSVREASGVEICNQVFGRPDAVHVLDPTMVVDPVFYEEIAAPPSHRAPPTLLSYVLDDEPDRLRISDEVLQALGPGFSHRSLKLDAGWATLDVPGWLRAFMDADFVLTDSFHGVVFSIIFRKNFIGIVNRNRGADRFTSLLQQLGLLDRLVSESDRGTVLDLVQRPIDYSAVEPRLSALRQISMAFLRNALHRTAQPEGQRN